MPRPRKKTELESLRDSLPLDKKRGRQTLKQFVAYDFNRDTYYVNLGKKEAGAQTSRYRSFKDPAEAEAFLAERLKAENENKQSAAILTRETVRDHFEQWLKVRRFETKSNQIFYENMINKHIVPALGDIELYALSPDDLDAYCSEKLEELSSNTVRKHQDVLKMGLKKAILARKITFNPMDAVELVRKKKISPDAYTMDEVRKILAICREEDSLYAHVTMLALYTGCRRGEIMGLQYNNVHLDAQNPYIVIVQSRSDTDEGVETGDTKTRRGKRAIALTTEGTALLKRLKSEYEANKSTFGNLFHDDNFVICYSDGTLPVPSSISRGYRKMLLRSGIGRVLRFHDLRHTFATLLKSTGATPIEIQDIMGHEHFSTTEDSYFADREGAIQSPINQLEALIANTDG